MLTTSRPAGSVPTADIAKSTGQNPDTGRLRPRTHVRSEWARRAEGDHDLADDTNSGSGDPTRVSVRLQDDLHWDATDPRHPVVIHDGQPVASFECLLPDERRVATRLEFLGGRRSVEVGVQPDTIVHLLRRLAMSRNNNVDAWQRALRRQLLLTSTEWGITTAIEPHDTLAEVIAVLGYPLVGLARSRGVRPPPFIPRWAEPVLVAAEPRAAARAVFGQRASRRVARALATSLVSHEAQGMVLIPLAFAIALPPAASSDVIANVLEGATAPHAPQHWPSVDQLHVIRRGFGLIGADASARLALETMQILDGPHTLAALMVHLPRLLASYNRSCPRRLQQLQGAVAEFVNEPVEMARRAANPQPRPALAAVPAPPVAPAPVAADAARQAGGRVAAHNHGGGIDLPVEPLYAPGPPREVPPGQEFLYRESVMRLHGARSGEHSLWLPRSRNELRAWGRELANCMPDYCTAVAAHDSIVLGLRRRDKLVAGIELTPDLRRVRQFVRDNNQRPWRAERDALRDMLGRLGVGGG